MFIVNLSLDDFQLVTENCPCRDLIHLNNHTTSRKDSSRNWFSFSRLHVMSPSQGHFHPTCFYIHNHTSSRRDTSRNWFSFSQSHFITAIQFTNLVSIFSFAGLRCKVIFPSQSRHSTINQRSGKKESRKCLSMGNKY